MLKLIRIAIIVNFISDCASVIPFAAKIGSALTLQAGAFFEAADKAVESWKGNYKVPNAELDSEQCRWIATNKVGRGHQLEYRKKIIADLCTPFYGTTDEKLK